MGIDAHALHLLRHSRRQHGPLGRTVTLGRQTLHLGPRAMEQWTGLRAAPGTAHCETLLMEHFGASVVDSIDNSAYEGASIVADMNLPLPDALAGRYDSVLDFGCTEHIFDIGMALRNAAGLCRPGGTILHVVPANGFCGHGFYQFSPELFFSYYAPRNGFEGTEVYLADLLDTRHWYQVARPSAGRRVNVRSRSETYVIVATKRVAVRDVEIQQSDYIHAWTTDAPGSLPPATPPRWPATLKEMLWQVPLLARCIHAIDSALSPHVPKPLHRHRELAKLRTDSLG